MRSPRSGIAQAVRRQAGVGLVTAIFILTILAGLGIAIVSLTSAQQATSALDVLQVRARLAARSGLEWALFNYANSGTPSVPCTASQSGSFAFPAGNTLSSFTVTVVCTINPVPAGSVTRITATACNAPVGGVCPAGTPPPSGDYVERSVIADLP